MPDTTTTPSGRSAKDLDKLAGYQGSIQCTPLDTALFEQQMALWEAQAIIDCVSDALNAHFGDWPKGLTNWPMALKRASDIIDRTTVALEAGTLEDRGLAIARETPATTA